MVTLKRKIKNFKIYAGLSMLNELSVFKCFGVCVGGSGVVRCGTEIEPWVLFMLGKCYYY